MTRNPDNRPLDDMVFDCCRELFSAYQLDVIPRDRADFPATEALALCGVMGFGGKSLRGALVLATTREPLEHTNPGSLTSQRDWVCELANQLMGRVKNRLLAYGVEIHLATPAGLSGDNLCPSPSHLRAPQVFAAADGFVCVWIDCEYSDGFELPTEQLEGYETPANEGETLLF
jgi:hypothetical protein